MPKDWYTTVEVAQMLSRSDRFVRDRVRDGSIPAMTGGGDKRASYKISHEALMTYMVTQEKKNAKEVKAVLKNVSADYLRELEELVMSERRRRGSPRVEIIPKCFESLRAIMELELRNYPGELAFHDLRPYEKNYKNPYHFTATAIDWQVGRAEGHMSAGLTIMDFYERLCAGKVADDCQPAWDEKSEPILYFSGMVIEDPTWAPFLFREMGRQLKEFERKLGINVKLCFAVAATDFMRGLLGRYGFVETARYKKDYSVMAIKDLHVGRLSGYVK